MEGGWDIFRKYAQVSGGSCSELRTVCGHEKKEGRDAVCQLRCLYGQPGLAVVPGQVRWGFVPVGLTAPVGPKAGPQPSRRRLRQGAAGVAKQHTGVRWGWGGAQLRAAPAHTGAKLEMQQRRHIGGRALFQLGLTRCVTISHLQEATTHSEGCSFGPWPACSRPVQGEGQVGAAGVLQ